MRAAVALVLALLATGCALRFELDPEAVISCSDDEDCLDNRVCRAGFCLTQEAIASPPAVVSSASLDREQASAGQVVTAVLSIDGVLRDPPTLALGTPAKTAFVLTPTSDGSYRFELLVTRELPEGAQALLVSFIDRGGNVVQDLVVGPALTIDLTAPLISASTSDADHPVRSGDTRVIDIVANEPLHDVSAVTAADEALIADPSVAPPRYRFTYTPATGAADGARPVTLTLGDRAGNVTVAPAVATFTVDNTPPALAETASVVATLLRAGEVLAADFVLSEPVTSTPAVVATGPGGTLTLDVRQVTATRFAASKPVPGGQTSGEYTLSLAAVADAAGNTSAALQLGSVVIDDDPPLFVVAPAVDRTTLSHAPGFDTAHVSFTLSEDLGGPIVDPALASVRVGARSTEPCTVTGAGNAWAYDCVYVVAANDPPGPQFVSVTVFDAAGNDASATAPSPIVHDFSPPSASAVSTSSLDPVKASHTRTVTIVANEPLLSATATATSASATRAVPAATAVPPSYTFDFTPGGADAEGEHVIDVTLVDAAGNSATMTAAAAFVVDNTPPALSGTPQVPQTLLRDGQVAQVTFGVDEALGALPIVALSGVSGPSAKLDVRAASADTYVASLLVGTSLPSGVYSLVAEPLVDVATNASAPIVLASITIDQHAPGFVVAPSADRTTLSHVTSYDRAHVTFAIDEDVGGEVASVRVGARATEPCTVTPQASTWAYDCLYIVDANDPPGPQFISVTVHDGAGNVSTTTAATPIVHDFTAPSASAITTTAATPVKLGQSRSLTIVANEPLLSATALATGSRVVPRDPSVSAPSYGFVFLVDAADVEGSYVTDVTLTDLAGNSALINAAAEFIVDNTAPALAGSATVTQSLVREGQVVEVAFSTSEPLSALPTVSLVSQAAPANVTSLAVRAVSATSYVASAVLPPGLASGDFDLVTGALVDAATNASAAITLGAVTVDNDAPVFVVSPDADLHAVSKMPPFNHVVVSFVLGEELSVGLPAVPSSVLRVRVGDRDAEPCTKTQISVLAWAYACELAVDNTDIEGAHFIAVNAVDAAGNANSETAAVPVVYDFTAPRLVGSGRLLRSDFYPLAQDGDSHVYLSKTATDGSAIAPTVTVTFALDEPLLTTGTGPTGPVFSLPGSYSALPGSSETFFVYRYTQPVSPPVNTQALDATVVDRVGNPTSVHIGDITFDNDAPALNAQMTLAKHLRAPWGTDTLPPGTARLVFDPSVALEMPARLVVLNGSNLNAAAVLRTVDLEVAQPSTIDIPGGNVPELYLALRDRAGNWHGTAALLVRRGEWIASLRQDGGTNPHRGVTQQHVTRRLQPMPGSVINDGTLNGVDGSRASVSNEGFDFTSAYRACSFGCTNPGPQQKPPFRDLYAGGYDRFSQRMVFFGGFPSFPATTPFADTWLWDGAEWAPGPGGPPGRYSAAMSELPMENSDGSATSLVLFGGAQLAGSGVQRFFCDTWRFDGTTWRQLDDDACASNPPSAGTKPRGRIGHALTYDPVRNKTVLTGGTCDTSSFPAMPCGDGTWEYGAQSGNYAYWTQVSENDPNVSARTMHGAAFDPVAQKLLIFAGLSQSGRNAELWEGTYAPGGITWSLRCTEQPLTNPQCLSAPTCTCTDSPPPMVMPSFVYMPDHDGVLLTGGVLGDRGYDPLNYPYQPPNGFPPPPAPPVSDEIWRWNGSDWERLAEHFGCSFDSSPSSTCKIVSDWNEAAYPAPGHPAIYAPDFGYAFQLDMYASSNASDRVLGLTTARKGDRPSLHTTVRFAQAQVPANAVTRIRANAIAGATTASAFDSSQSDGSELWLWDHTTAQPSGKMGWFTGPLNASSASTPGVLAFDSSALGGPRLLLDPVTNEISLMTVATGGKDFSTLSVDYLDVTVDYLLP